MDSWVDVRNLTRPNQIRILVIPGDSVLIAGGLYALCLISSIVVKVSGNMLSVLQNSVGREDLQASHALDPNTQFR